MSRAALALCAVAAIAGATWQATTGGDADPRPPLPATISPLTAAVAAGTHARVEGPHGAIHVWLPAGYHADGAATVIYIHGYYTPVDYAYFNFQLAEQFAMSGLNAMFIVPEAPVRGGGTPINYPQMSEVIRIAEDAVNQPRGTGPVVAFGHSGAYRTIESWLDEPLLDTVVMFDSTYGDQDSIRAWFNASPHHRLITVAEDTMVWTEELARMIPETVTLDRFPISYDAWPPEARTARHLYIRSQWGHVPLVTDGNAVPMLLRLLPVEILPSEPWQHPLGQLPPKPDAAIDAPSASSGSGDAGASGTK